MAQRVAGELYELVTGKLFEIARQLRQPGGYPYNANFLNDALQELIEGRFPSSVTRLRRFDPEKFFGTGCASVRDVRSASLGRIDYTKVVFDTGLRDTETIVRGDVRRARILGREDAVALNLDHFLDLWTNPEKIPESFKQGLITFDGDDLRHTADKSDMLFLYRLGKEWSWDWCGLDDDFGALHRSALLPV